jgi:hypothetical protein
MKEIPVDYVDSFYVSLNMHDIAFSVIYMYMRKESSLLKYVNLSFNKARNIQFSLIKMIFVIRSYRD